MRSAYDFVMLLRIRRHFAQKERGEATDNTVNFKELNRLQGRFLVQSLHTIAELEDYVKDKYGGVAVV